MGIGYFYQKSATMNPIFIFMDDDFREVVDADLTEMQTGRLVESLQGTLIGLHTVKEVTDRVTLVDMGPYTQFKRAEDDVSEKLTKGLGALISQLTDRLGVESVERIIQETLFMVDLEKKEQDGK